MRDQLGGERMMRSPHLAHILRDEPVLQSVELLKRAGRVLGPGDHAVEGPAH